MIPPTTKEAIDRYIKEGIEPGGFIKAVLSNNLYDAIFTADSENLSNLKDIITYLYKDAPIAALGSTKAVENWIQIKRLAKEVNSTHPQLSKRWLETQ